MHERNIYLKNRVDFVSLGQRYPYFKKYLVNGKPSINWKDSKGVRELTYALLAVDFGLAVEFPLSRLCPTVPSRLDYIHLIEDLFINDGRYDHLVGIDIGTGAAAIYPLLACSMHPKWSFLAYDIDEESLAYARANVERNQLSENIQLFHNQDTSTVLLPEATLKSFHQQYDFLMCNPPFYSTDSQLLTPKAKEPYAICTASARELKTKGGELEFVKSMYSASLSLPVGYISVYSSLFGHLSSFKQMLKFLESEPRAQVLGKNSIIQSRTTRWIIFWKVL